MWVLLHYWTNESVCSAFQLCCKDISMFFLVTLPESLHCIDVHHQCWVRSSLMFHQCWLKSSLTSHHCLKSSLHQRWLVNRSHNRINQTPKSWSNQFCWNIWGEKSNQFSKVTWDDEGKKERTSETANCISL